MMLLSLRTVSENQMYNFHSRAGFSLRYFPIFRFFEIFWIFDILPSSFPEFPEFLPISGFLGFRRNLSPSFRQKVVSIDPEPGRSPETVLTVPQDRSGVPDRANSIFVQAGGLAEKPDRPGFLVPFLPISGFLPFSSQPVP